MQSHSNASITSSASFRRRTLAGLLETINECATGANGIIVVGCKHYRHTVSGSYIKEFLVNTLIAMNMNDVWFYLFQ